LFRPAQKKGAYWDNPSPLNPLSQKKGAYWDNPSPLNPLSQKKGEGRYLIKGDINI